MNSLSLPVVDPSFQKLKKSGRLLHFAAGVFILIHAVSHFREPHSNPVYLGCLLLMGLDILILVAAGKNIALELPRVNLFFRLVEIIFFAGIGITMLKQDSWFSGAIHLVLCLAYSYLFYCEKKAHTEEYVAIHHTGVSVPSLPESKFFSWSNIDHIEARYDSITINTSLNKIYHFDLRRNLAFEELDQIHEFCRHYLGKPQNA